jgi:hypothetical protein
VNYSAVSQVSKIEVYVYNVLHCTNGQSAENSKSNMKELNFYLLNKARNGQALNFSSNIARGLWTLGSASETDSQPQAKIFLMI